MNSVCFNNLGGGLMILFDGASQHLLSRQYSCISASTYKNLCLLVLFLLFFKLFLGPKEAYKNLRSAILFYVVVFWGRWRGVWNTVHIVFYVITTIILIFYGNSLEQVQWDSLHPFYHPLTSPRFRSSLFFRSNGALSLVGGPRRFLTTLLAPASEPTSEARGPSLSRCVSC